MTDEQFERRVRLLPSQLERARQRVVHLEREAVRLGMHDLLIQPEIKGNYHEHRTSRTQEPAGQGVQ